MMPSMGDFTSPPSHNATQEHEHSSKDSIERPPDNATQEHENSLQDSTSIESSTNNSFPDTNDLQTEVPHRNPQRDRQPPAKMNDYVSYTAKKAMQEELAALVENKTWSIVSLPKGKHAVGSRWVFKTKFNSDGSVDRYKACLVAQGCTQQYGVV
uniref:Putative RNA-directed DNA polymerase n=1 Tax=Tanacetum cinerariifolium TaxID=118510 RepID=A0A699QPE0_TANCI|nr:putative RNA-directed DNA polymerase [Tanacetum cinerariifolium]